MKLDIWKSAVNGRSLVSVPAGVEPWSVLERSKLSWDMQDIRLFRRGVDASETPLVDDPSRITSLIKEQGFALHTGSLQQPEAASRSPVAY